MSELKPCPFCGAKLIKAMACENLAEPVEIYEHPSNNCILSINTDEFTYMVPVGMIETWNRRTKDGKRKADIRLGCQTSDPKG